MSFCKVSGLANCAVICPIIQYSSVRNVNSAIRPRKPIRVFVLMFADTLAVAVVDAAPALPCVSGNIPATFSPPTCNVWNIPNAPGLVSLISRVLMSLFGSSALMFLPGPRTRSSPSPVEYFFVTIVGIVASFERSIIMHRESDIASWVSIILDASENPPSLRGSRYAINLISGRYGSPPSVLCFCGWNLITKYVLPITTVVMTDSTITASGRSSPLSSNPDVIFVGYPSRSTDLTMAGKIPFLS